MRGERALTRRSQQLRRNGPAGLCGLRKPAAEAKAGPRRQGQGVGPGQAAAANGSPGCKSPGAPGA